MTNEIKLSYASFRESFPASKAASDPLFSRIVLRPLSLPVAWVLYKVGFSANQVTIASIGLALVASGLLLAGTYTLTIVAAALFLLVALGDCVDGNVARARSDSGPGGEWMDALCGYTVYALLPLALGLQLELSGAAALFAGMWVFVGAVTAISNLHLRVVYQKYVNSMKPEATDGGGNNGKSGLLSRVSGELGLVGWMMPALLLAIVLEAEPLYLFFYCAFYFTAAVIGTVVLARRILRDE